MFQQISLYWVGHERDKVRVTARYTSGATHDQTYPVGNLEPFTIDLPATNKGDPAARLVLDTRQGGRNE